MPRNCNFERIGELFARKPEMRTAKIATIAEELSVSRNTASDWLRRWQKAEVVKPLQHGPDLFPDLTLPRLIKRAIARYESCLQKHPNHAKADLWRRALAELYRKL